MKSTGIVRKVDDLGRIVIPMEIRKTFDIKEKDPIEIFTDGDNIVLKQFKTSCTLCGNDKYEDLSFKFNKPICKDCLNVIKNGPNLIGDFEGGQAK